VNYAPFNPANNTLTNAGARVLNSPLGMYKEEVRDVIKEVNEEEKTYLSTKKRDRINTNPQKVGRLQNINLL